MIEEKEVCDCCEQALEFCPCKWAKRRLIIIMDAIEIVRQMNSIEDALDALEDMKVA